MRIDSNLTTALYTSKHSINENVIKVDYADKNINNVETTYFTQLKHDNIWMSVGHLDHVLIVYSSMEHVTWKSPGSHVWVSW